MKLKSFLFIAAISVILFLVFWEAIKMAVVAFLWIIGIYFKMLVLALITVLIVWLYIKSRKKTTKINQ